MTEFLINKRFLNSCCDIHEYGTGIGRNATVVGVFRLVNNFFVYEVPSWS